MKPLLGLLAAFLILLGIAALLGGGDALGDNAADRARRNGL